MTERIQFIPSGDPSNRPNPRRTILRNFAQLISVTATHLFADPVRATILRIAARASNARNRRGRIPIPPGL